MTGLDQVDTLAAQYLPQPKEKTVIKITLEFPDADDAILALAALREKNLTGGPAVPGSAKIKVKGTPPEEVVAGAPAGKPATTGKPAASPGTAAATTTTPAAGAAEQKPGSSSGESEVIEYPQVSAAITAAVAVDKARVIKILTDFKCKSGKDLKPEQYAEFLAVLNPTEAEGDLS